MRFYLDEHMPLQEISHRLRRKGHSYKHAVRLGFRGRDDAFNYQFARSEKRILVTQDMDFANPQKYPYRKHPGVIILDVSRDADPRPCSRFSTTCCAYSESARLGHHRTRNSVTLSPPKRSFSGSLCLL